jgi:hypothetical protein
LVFVTQFLPQLQRRQAEQGENSRKNPKPDDDRVFLPTHQFEVMMKRRHREDPPAGKFEAQNLEDDRDRFDDEDAANNHQQQFLFAADRYDANQSADGK